MNSKRSNSRRAAVLLAAAWLMACTGCVHSRIVPVGGYAKNPGGEGEVLRVLEVEVATGAETALWPLETKRTREVTLQNFQGQLQEVCPARFADRPDAIPVLVRLQCTVTEESGTGTEGAYEAFASVPAALPAILTLFTIPVRTGCLLRMEAFIQLGPGKWSDGVAISAKKESMTFNPLGNLLFGWMLSEKNGWQAEGDDTARPDTVETMGTKFSLLSHLQGAEGDNPRFVETVAALVASAWDDLTVGEKSEARRNPVARKLFAERFPFEAAGAMSDGQIVPVPVPGPLAARESATEFRVVREGFDAETRRGFVVFEAGGTDHLRALERVRMQVIPRLVGEGGIVRFLSEGMEGAGLFRIEFEKVE